MPLRGLSSGLSPGARNGWTCAVTPGPPLFEPSSSLGDGDRLPSGLLQSRLAGRQMSSIAARIAQLLMRDTLVRLSLLRYEAARAASAGCTVGTVWLGVAASISQPPSTWYSVCDQSDPCCCCCCSDSALLMQVPAWLAAMQIDSQMQLGVEGSVNDEQQLLKQ